MKPQDPKAESITFGVELETTIPATAGLVIGGYLRQPGHPDTRTPGSAASDPTNETMNQQTAIMILNKLKARARREAWS